MPFIKSMVQCLKEYKDHFLIERRKLNGLICPSIVRLGKDILADVGDKAVLQKHWNFLKDRYTDFNFKYNKLTKNVNSETGSIHSDSIFAILRPGLILTEQKSHLYSELYPNWDILEVNRNMKNITGWTMGLKNKMMPYFYMFENKKYHQEAFYEYINKWLTDWVGYSQETVWDINCLVLDEENVVFSAENKDLFKKLEKYKINPIVSPFRHRWFWDGGIHCITLDIRRKCSCEQYL